MVGSNTQQNIHNTAPNQGAQGNFYGEVKVIYEAARTHPNDPRLLEAARQLFSQMPTATLPPHNSLPPGSRMPFERNPHFVGRETDLLAIAHALTQGTAVAVTGMGGLGKTSIATEFVRRYGQFFAGGVYWLSFAEPDAISSEVVQCGAFHHLALHSKDTNLSLSDQVAQVQSTWRQEIPRLLVFDNCDANEIESVVQEWMPQSGGCRILITGRRGRWSEALGIEVLPLQTLPREQSLALLHQHRPDLDNADADAIAEELGDLPLALYLAGSYLDRYRVHATPANYLAELRRSDLLNHRSLRGERMRHETNPTAHDLNIGRSFALSYNQLDAADSIDALALQLLARTAYFAPGEPIPRTVLLATLHLDAPDTEALMDAEDGLHRLNEVGLLMIERQDGSLTLHRLLARFVKQIAQDDAAQASVEKAMIDTSYELNEQGVPTPLLPLLPHLRHITDAALKREDAQAVTLANVLGRNLYMIADYTAARPLLERALAIREQALGPMHPDVAQSLNNLALLLHSEGDYAVTRTLYERAIGICEQTLGPDHPNTATSLINLAELLRDQGDYVAARSLCERALAIYEQVLGPNHTHTAASLNTLAVLLKAQGDYATARPLLERALAIHEQVLGPNHPNTVRILNNLAGLMLKLGDYATARPFLERALAIHEQVLGPNHIHTAISLNNLAELLHSQGDYGTARPLYDRALAIYEQTLGSDHPGTALILNNLAVLHYQQGEYAVARPLLERALAIREQVLGPNHPDTQSSRQSLTAIEKRLQRQSRPRWKLW